MDPEKPLKKQWAIPAVMIISRNKVSSGHNHNFHEGSIVPVATFSTKGGIEFFSFKTGAGNKHALVETAPGLPAQQYYAS